MSDMNEIDWLAYERELLAEIPEIEDEAPRSPFPFETEDPAPVAVPITAPVPEEDPFEEEDLVVPDWTSQRPEGCLARFGIWICNLRPSVQVAGAVCVAYLGYCFGAMLVAMRQS